MRLSQICIKRPVFATVLSLAILVMGLMGYYQLHWRFYPEVFSPSLYVRTTYTGASAAQVENLVTQKLENALSGTPDLWEMMSDSQQGFSHIELHFHPISRAQFVLDQSQVMQAIASVNLPEAVSRPIIHMSDRGQNQLMIVALSDPKQPFSDISNYAKNVVVKQLQQVPGVGSVDIFSASPALRIELEPKRLAAYHLSENDVITVLEQNNVMLPAGQLVGKKEIIPINSKLALANLNAFEQLVVAKRKSELIRLKDIAKVVIGQQTLAGVYSAVNGHPAVVLSISYKDGANPIALGSAMNRRLNAVRQFLPPGMKLTKLIDFSTVLKHSVREVFFTIFEAILLVVLVTLLFLGSLRATLIPVVTIPVCLISAFAVMFALGFSINVMSLLGLVLAVGMVVDDAIVVMENNHRHLEAGLAPVPAAQKSIDEISFAVIAMTICLLAVYVPVIFISGKVAIFVRQFAFTLAACVMISGFVALTLSPMMCSRFLAKQGQSRYERWLDRVFKAAKRGYRQLLQSVLSHRRWVVVVFGLLVIGGGFIFKSLPSTLLPPSDAGIVIAFTGAPEMASTEYVFKRDTALVSSWLKLPEVESIASFAGGGGNDSNTAFNFLQLKPWYQRKRSTEAVAMQVAQTINQQPGLDGGAIALDLNSDHNSFNKGSLRFMITGMASYPALIHAEDRFEKRLKQLKSVRDVDGHTGLGEMEYNLVPRRDLMMQLGISAGQVSQAIQTYLGGYKLTQDYVFNGIGYPVYVQLPKSKLGDFAVLKAIYLQTGTGNWVPLSRLVTIERTTGTSDRYHINQLRGVLMSLSVNTAQGYTAGQVADQINAIAKSVLPANMQVVYLGSALKMIEGHQQMQWIFVLGLVFIYLILAALFESFIDPLIILLTVPLCVVGALAVLKLAGGSFNMFTAIGLVTLIGLVSKHGILIVRFANELVEQGENRFEAVKHAATIRLRPILMTTATMVLGALPLLFSSGPGSGSRIQIGIVVVAGLLIGTLFSLLIVPVAYTFRKR